MINKVGLTLLLATLSCAPGKPPLPSTKGATQTRKKLEHRETKSMPQTIKLATFGGGCFWCVEAVFERLDGVSKVESGYAGGHVDNPTYEQICGKQSGHAEVCQISYDPAKIRFEELLEVFWKTHDPTTKDRQGNDVGPQYRSVILFHDTQQQQLAATYKAKLDAAGAFGAPIVTEIQPFTKFWIAEKYHQDYFSLNKNRNPYCQAVIVPKVTKFEQVFRDKLKKR